jgi:glycosyltransferase involved in cell wall biosynthesis
MREERSGMTGTIVFVTRELFPFTAGGIGRAIANILDLPEFSVSLDNPDASRVAVVFLGDGLTSAHFHGRFPHALFVDASADTYVEVDEEGFRYPPPSQFTTHSLHAESVRAMQSLKRLERQYGALSYVEFPDWGATAFASLQEKKLGLAFRDAVLAVRLHTSDSILNATESRTVDQTSLVLYDLERKSLADCDLIVGQVPSTAQFMQSFFDFEDSEWTSRLAIHAPPVVLDHGLPAQMSVVPGRSTPIVFSSKIQRIKRPDVFVRGVCDFLRGNAEYEGVAQIVASAPDAEYVQQIKRLIPIDLAHRFRFIDNASPESRAHIVSSSVCVFPGTFESFCLAAYEASMSGALCLVNATNPAFSENSPWKDGVNCAKFDGTPAGLTHALRDVFRGARDVEPVEVPTRVGPWMLERARSCSTESAEKSLPLVSVLVPHYNMGGYVERTIQSALSSDYAKIEVVLVDDASTDESSREVVQRLKRSDDGRIRVITSPANRGLAATRNIALEHARGEFSLTLDADDLIDPRFVSIAARALVSDPELSFVVPQTAYFDARSDPDTVDCAWLRCMTFVGEARASGLFQNKFSTATSMARTHELRALRYDESLIAYEDWDLYLRASMSRKRFVVTNALQFYYRHRHDSMIHNEAAAARLTIYYHDLLRTKHFVMGRNRLPMYIFEGAAGAQQGESIKHLRERIAAYENSMFVAAALSVRAFVDTLPKWIRAPVKWLAGTARRRRVFTNSK